MENQPRIPVISARNISKFYRVFNSPLDRFESLVLESIPKPGNFFRNWARQRIERKSKSFHALENVSFEIFSGESVGIIGRNGSGKSTLLQIIAGTRPPTAGSVDVRGRVAAILELGSGFKPAFTGRENVYVNGLILGLTKAEIDARMPEIEAFADIGDFVDQPVKTYSSGMLVRLVFAVQVALSPDILIVDEALAVGDVFFQQKCAERLKKLKDSGTTILFVSHSMQVVRNLCEKVIYLKEGRMEFFGPAFQGTAMYFANAGGADSRRTFSAPVLQNAGEEVVADVPGLEIWKRKEPATSPVSVRRLLLDDSAAGVEKSLSFLMGETCRLILQVQSHSTEVQSFHFGFSLKNSYNQILNGTSTHNLGQGEISLAPGKTALIRVGISLALETGEYTFNLAIGGVDESGNWQRMDATGWVGPLVVSWGKGGDPAPFHGPFGIPVSVEVEIPTN